MKEQKSRAVLIGDRVSEWVSNLFAHPYMQIAVIVLCGAWFLVGLRADILTAVLSILAITLSQMVLNRQGDREAEDRKRDIAMHAKLDELLHAKRGARDEMMGIEDLEEMEIVALKEEVKAAIDAEGEKAGDRRERATAKAAVDKAGKPSARKSGPVRSKAKVKA